MSYKLGNTDINQIYLGNTEVKQIYLGNALVYQKREFAFLQSVNSTANLAAYTFAAQNFGAAATNRYIIAVINMDGTDGVTSVTIGGVAATVVATAVTGSLYVSSIAIALVPTGATGDVVIDPLASGTQCQVSLYRATNLVSATPIATTTSSSSNPTLNINVQAGGFAVAGGINNNGGAGVSWSGLTENLELSSESRTLTTASIKTATTESPKSISATFVSASTCAAVAASFK